MELRWLIGVSVMGLLLTVATSQKYPQQKSPNYSTERIPPARYYSDRPITQDDYRPVKPVYGSNAPERGNYNKYLNSAGGSYSKYPPKDYNVPLSYCPEVGGLESHCRPAKDCAVWYDLVRKTPGTSCTLENGQGKGICCPDLPYNG
jgi:peroxidase